MDGTKTAKKIVTEYYCKQTMTFINEPNVNCCIFHSRKEEAFLSDYRKARRDT